MQFTLTQLLQVFIILQNVLLTIFLLSQKRGKLLANRILASLLLVMALQMTVLLIPENNIVGKVLDSFNCVFGFLYGVLIFLYTRSLVYHKISFRFLTFLHFLPALMLFVLILFKITQCQFYIFPIYMLSILSYITYSLFDIYRYQKVIKATTSQTDAKINLRWLQWTILIFLFVILADIFRFFIDQIALDWLSIVAEIFLFFCILFFINTMVFRGLTQPQIFVGIEVKDIQFLEKKEDDKETSTEQKRILVYMQEAKPYFNSNLTLAELAKELDLAPRQLSNIINQSFETNFSEFINDYRIEEAKKRFENPKDSKETILEVMYAVGFNSKSSFNTLFRKKTGLTPSQYKKNNQKL